MFTELGHVWPLRLRRVYLTYLNPVQVINGLNVEYIIGQFKEHESVSVVMHNFKYP